MKRVIKNIKRSFLVAPLISASLSYANIPYSNILKKDFKKTSLAIEHVKDRTLLTIKDYNGLIIYKEKSETYSKGFDLSSLPDGDYLCERKNGMEIKTNSIIVISNQVVFIK